MPSVGAQKKRLPRLHEACPVAGFRLGSTDFSERNDGQMHDKNRGKRGAADELAALDRHLVDTLARRSRLLARLRDELVPPGTQQRSPGRAWAELEKRLRGIWDVAAPSAAAGRKIWRQMFLLAQELARQEPGRHAGKGAEEASPQRGFVLRPRSGPMAVDMPGPVSTATARLWTVLGVTSDTPWELAGALANDPMIDLIKAFNQVGGRLYWDDDGIKNRGGAQLEFTDKTVYAGDDPLNFYSLLFMATTTPGRMKLTGGAYLKMLDLDPLSSILPALGARLVTLARGSSGAPVRLESSAVFSDELTLHRELSPEALIALVAASPRFPSGLRLRWLPGQPWAAPLQELLAGVVDLLHQCGLQADLTAGRLYIAPGVAMPPDRPAIGLDSLLSCTLLALPLFARPLRGREPAGGRVRLQGLWPAHLPEWRTATELLAAAGLDVETDSAGVASRLGKSTHKEIVLDWGAFPAFFPLSLALALGLTERGQAPGGVRVRSPRQTEDMLCCRDLLDVLGFDALDAGDFLELTRKSDSAPDQEDASGQSFNNAASPPPLTPWTSPSAPWTLACALLSYVRSGLLLANPGTVTASMPGFWPLFNTLPKPEQALAQAQARQEQTVEVAADQAGTPKPRRFRVQSGGSSHDE